MAQIITFFVVSSKLLKSFNNNCHLEDDMKYKISTLKFLHFEHVPRHCAPHSGFKYAKKQQTP